MFTDLELRRRRDINRGDVWGEIARDISLREQARESTSKPYSGVEKASLTISLVFSALWVAGFISENPNMFLGGLIGMEGGVLAQGAYLLLTDFNGVVDRAEHFYLGEY